MKEKCKIIILLIILVFILSLTPLYALPNNCPKESCARIWEPCSWVTDNIIYGLLLDSITASQDQGYSIGLYYDNSLDEYFYYCLRDYWDDLAENTGIFVLNSHGNSDQEFLAVYNTDKSKLIDETGPSYDVTWADKNADGIVDDGMHVGWSSDESAWCVYIHPEDLGDMFQSTLSANDAIVHLAFCYSDYSENSFLDYCHGAIGFGYPSTITDGETDIDAYLIFNLMNGTIENGEYREALQAYDRAEDGLFGENIHCNYKTGAGYEGITLCPSVMNTGIIPFGGSSFEEGEGAGSSGQGYILFDSHCVPIYLTYALVFDITGTVSIENVQWSEIEGYEDCAITFDYCGEGDYTVDVSVIPGWIVGDGCQELDGGNSSSNGVAPNNDPYYFSFSD